MLDIFWSDCFLQLLFRAEVKNDVEMVVVRKFSKNGSTTSNDQEASSSKLISSSNVQSSNSASNSSTEKVVEHFIGTPECENRVLPVDRMPMQMVEVVEKEPSLVSHEGSLMVKSVERLVVCFVGLGDLF